MAAKKINISGLSEDSRSGSENSGKRYTAAAGTAAENLNTAADSAAAGFDALKAQTARDYAAIAAGRTALAAADGDRGALGTAQPGTDSQAAENAAGSVTKQQKSTAAALADSERRLNIRAQGKAASAEAQQEALQQELTAKEGQRSGDAAREAYEQQQALAQDRADTAQTQAEARTRYLQQMGLVCLQLGYMPGEEMLTAMGIDANTARSLISYYRSD